jgi:pimeloyl-ACP methyl ester carboxylesterase
MHRLLKTVILLSAALLASCVSVSRKPDLDLLYRASYLNENAVPIIIIPGLMGTTLVDAKGAEVWPKSVSNLAFSTFEDLTEENSDGIRPGRLLDGLIGLDYYGTLLKTLNSAGHYEEGRLNSPVINKNKRRYYVFLYDWRKSNFDSVGRLHTLIDQIRVDYKDPGLKVDIIAHSNGGSIARYYLQYGPQDGQSRKKPEPWTEGDRRIRRIAMLGTPNLGSVISVNRLYNGFRIGLRTIPPHIMVNFATPFEAFPSPAHNVFIDANGTTVPLAIYDPALWQRNKWSIYSDESRQLVSAEAKDPARRLALLEERFTENLQQAFDFQSALAKPIAQTKTQIALFGGDCDMTASRAVVNWKNGKMKLAFEEGDIADKGKNIDYKYLLNAPGDGLVTRESQLARSSTAYLDNDLQKDLFPIAQTTFFCESHEMLTGNPYFQNNLLYFLFH